LGKSPNVLPRAINNNDKDARYGYHQSFIEICQVVSSKGIENIISRIIFSRISTSSKNARSS
jgi:hypothetical protein